MLGYGCYKHFAPNGAKPGLTDYKDLQLLLDQPPAMFCVRLKRINLHARQE